MMMSKRYLIALKHEKMFRKEATTRKRDDRSKKLAKKKDPKQNRQSRNKTLTTIRQRSKKKV